MKDEKYGLSVTVINVQNINPLKTKSETLFFYDVEKGKEFVKENVVISSQLVKIVN